MNHSGITSSMKTNIKATLQKISKNVNAITFDVMEGHFTELPVPGKVFHFSVLDSNPSATYLYTLLATSHVKEVSQKDNVYTIVTTNSIYELVV